MNVDHLLSNATLFTARCFRMVDRAGADVVVAVAKMTYEISSDGVVSVPQDPAPIAISDVPRSPQRFSSLVRASDLADDKPGTDVLLVGAAHPPAGKQVGAMEVSLRVEAGARTIQRTVVVHGPRVWQRSALGLVVPGPAAPLSATPLVYELTWGGAALDADPPRVDWRNPAGTGAEVAREALVGRVAPAIEDPDAPLSSRSPAPAGFGPVPGDWSPRSERQGTYDDAWRRERAPLRPIDFDPRWHSVAPPGLWTDAPLSGDEPVEVLGATPEGAWRFRLPSYRPAFSTLVGGETLPRPTHLDTFLVDAEAKRVELTWRASVRVRRKPDAIRAFVVTAEREDAVADALAASFRAGVGRTRPGP